MNKSYKEKRDPLVALSIPDLSGNEKKYVNECLDTNWISSAGAYVNEFELAFAKYVGVENAIAVASGTAALHLSLIVSDICQNDEIFISSLTFISPVNALRYVGAYPVFIDSEQETLCISPESLKKFITKNCTFINGELKNKLTGRTIRGLLVVHIYGHSAKMKELCAIADEFNLILIEDAAEAVACKYKGTHIGNFGNISCFSFNGNKILTTGGGGMVTTANKTIANRIKHLSTQAKSDILNFAHDEVGYNYRMNNIQAAIGVAQLEHIDDMINKRRDIYNRYIEAFKNIFNITVFTEQRWCHWNCWMCLLLIPAERKISLIEYLLENAIQARPFWNLNHLHPMYKECSKSDFSNAEYLHACGVSIPCHSMMTDDDVERVIEAVKQFMR